MGRAATSRTIPEWLRFEPMRVVIVGAGGQGSIVAEALRAAREAGQEVEPLGFVDDEKVGALADLPILGPIRDLPGIPHDAIVVAIGDNAARRARTFELEEGGETIGTARHPWSSVAPGVTIGAGAMISAGVVITPRAWIGRGVLLNTRSSVDHETTIGDFAHVSVGATVGARVAVGEEALIGLGASVMTGCRVGARSVIGAGAVVVRDVPEDVVAYGNPARVRRRLR